MKQKLKRNSKSNSFRDGDNNNSQQGSPIKSGSGGTDSSPKQSPDSAKKRAIIGDLLNKNKKSPGEKLPSPPRVVSQIRYTFDSKEGQEEKKNEDISDEKDTKYQNKSIDEKADDEDDPIAKAMKRFG